jgi:hypothetical protein
MSQPNFFFECSICKGKIPATWADPFANVKKVIAQKGEKSEMTFVCRPCQGAQS